jgi:hypothetical protein
MSDAPPFEFRISVPHDPRLAAAVRGVAIQAAQYVGCDAVQAEAFGRSVEEIVRSYLVDEASAHDVKIVIRRAGGPLEIQIESRTITLEPSA